MDMYPDILRKQIDQLNENLKSLNHSVNKFSKTSDNLQTKLIFWTKVMAWAIIVQAIAIGFQIFLAFFK